jgi:hypothetical protein
MDENSKKNNKLNISQFTRDLETKLINFKNNDIIINDDISIKSEPLSIKIDSDKCYNYDIIIFSLVFIILNNNLIITYINNNINDNININLIIRSALFLLIIYLIKTNLFY